MFFFSKINNCLRRQCINCLIDCTSAFCNVFVIIFVRCNRYAVGVRIVRRWRRMMPPRATGQSRDDCGCNRAKMTVICIFLHFGYGLRKCKSHVSSVTKGSEVLVRLIYCGGTEAFSRRNGVCWLWPVVETVVLSCYVRCHVTCLQPYCSYQIFQLFCESVFGKYQAFII